MFILHEFVFPNMLGCRKGRIRFYTAKTQAGNAWQARLKIVGNKASRGVKFLHNPDPTCYRNRLSHAFDPLSLGKGVVNKTHLHCTQTSGIPRITRTYYNFPFLLF